MRGLPGTKHERAPKASRKRLSYTNVAATLALVLAMSGGALAASKYIITSKKQIKPSVLTSLSGKRGKTGATGKPGPQGVQGNPGSAGAPNPNATAVDGQTVTKIFGTVASGGAAIPVYSGQGLTITFSCPTAGNDQVVANGPVAANTNLVWQGNGSAGTSDPFQGRVENLGPSSNTVIGDGNYGAGVATYATAAGNVVTISYGFDDANSGVSVNCSIWGHAVSG